MENNPKKDKPKPIQFALDSRSVKRRQRHLRLMDNDPPHTVQKLWKEHWRGMRTDEELTPNVIRAPYGRHLGRETEWNEDKRRFVTRGRAKLMPIHGPPNWDQLWPKNRDMGTDFKVKHPATQPLSDRQRALLNENSHRYYIINFWKNLSSGTFGTVWSVECMKKNDPNATQTELLACKIIKLETEKIEASIRVTRLILMDLQIGMMLSWLTRDGQRQPNLIPYHDVITIPDEQTRFPFSAMLVLMPICHGDLCQLFNAFHPQFLPHPVIKRWMNHISSAVQFLHERDIVHLDIKPGNILVKFPDPSLELTRQNAQTKWNTITFLLSDFGLSRMHLQSDGGVIMNRVGTINFMSPELFALQGPYNLRTPVRTKPCDIYALGVTLFACRTKGSEWTTLTANRKIEDFMGQLTQPQYAALMPPDDHQFAKLIYGMTRNDANNRFTIQQVVAHPYVPRELPAPAAPPAPAGQAAQAGQPNLDEEEDEE